MDSSTLLDSAFRPYALSQRRCEDLFGPAPELLDRLWGDWAEPASFALLLYNLEFPVHELATLLAEGTPAERRVRSSLEWGGTLAVHGAFKRLVEAGVPDGALCDGLRAMCPEAEFYARLAAAIERPPGGLRCS